MARHSNNGSHCETAHKRLVSAIGQVAEWFKAAVLKTGIGGHEPGEISPDYASFPHNRAISWRALNAQFTPLLSVCGGTPDGTVCSRNVL